MTKPEDGKARIEQKIDKALGFLRGATAKSHLRPGAGPGVLQLGKLLLARGGYPELPLDYEVLLSRTCGVMGPYFTLLSPGPMEMADGNFQRDFRTESDMFNAGREGQEKVLVLGRLSGNALLVFEDKKYHAVDARSHDVLKTYEDLADFITQTVRTKEMAAHQASAQV